MFRPDKWGLQFSSRVVWRSFHLRCSEVKESSLRAEKFISSCNRGLRLPSVGCLVDAAAWLDRRGRLKKTFTPFLRLKVTQAVLDGIFDRMLSTRVWLSYDAIVNRVLPRKVAQAVKVPMTLDSRS